MTPTAVRVWLDPSCPWAWQTHRWLRDLEDRGEVALDHAFFSLEVNASIDVGTFAERAPRYGEALGALVLARREGGHRSVSDLYAAIGRLLHDEKRPMGDGLLREAAHEVGMLDLLRRANAPDVGEELLNQYRSARELDVFGVPTLQVDDGKTMYGPILAVGPTGHDGLALWREVHGLLRRDAFFELKRWPRDLRPGGAPTGDPA